MSSNPSASPQVAFRRRIGPDPHENGAKTVALNNCPDIWELENGDLAVIGINITEEVLDRLPPTAGCGPDERVVRLPRQLVLNAQKALGKLT